jgi:photosystem II stability/assembly factor-like uncharacterized protein
VKKILLILLILVSTRCIFTQWVQQSSGTTNVLTNVFFTDQNTGIAIGLSGTVRKTTNAGANWFTQTLVNENLYGIFYANASTGFICGDGGYITRTTNGGTTWVTQTPPVELYRGLFFFDASTGFACGSTGTIAKTTNSGANWNSMNSGVTVTLQNIKFANLSTGYAVGPIGTVIKTTDGGDNWSSLTSGVTDPLFGLAVISADIVYASGEGGKFIKTTNGGSSWTELNTGIVNRGVNLFFQNANTGTAACLNNIILTTTNGGNTWVQQNSGLTGQDFNGVSFTSALTGYVVGSNGNILHTTTAGFPVPGTPVLLTPVNGAINVSLTATLDWDTASSAKTYQVQLATDTSYASPVLDSSNNSLSQINVPAGLLNNNVLYFWRVRASNAGATGSWSYSFRFRSVVALPTAPNLILPINGATNVSLNPTFDWDSTSPADYYTLQASLDTSFSNLEVFITSITQSFLPLVTPLDPNFKYYWRVNATNPAGTSPWSAKFNFITELGPPAAPILLYPADGAIGINLTPTLDWIDDYSVTSYQVQLSQDSLFNTTLIDATGFNTSQYSVVSGLLTNVATYYWRVRTTNSLGTGPWSEVWSFFTLLSPPAVPTLVSPPNNSIDITTTPTLDWDSIPFAETYRVQLSTDPNFGSFIINVAGLTSSHYNVSGGTLNNNTTYYWRVSATNQAGTSAFSAVWNFKTVVSPPVAAPTLLSPPNGATNQTLTPNLDWNDVFGTQGYKVIIAVDSFFNTLVLDTTITPSQLTIPAGKLNGSTTYYWRVRGFNIGGFGPWSLTFRFRTGPIGITQLGNEIPKEYKLYNNYPNPFNPVTKIKFDLPKASFVTIKVFDITGRQVTELVNKDLNAGAYETSWDASGFASGIYVYRIQASSFTSVKKMVVVK